MLSEDNDYNSLPGGDNFYDVTGLFTALAQSIDPANPIFADGYTMHDAMSALEIGEPRMDSGMILEQQRTTPFNPLTPLLPLEVCWILDRSFSCEMEWHAGNTLSQSVYTCLYVHYLDDINPDFFSRLWSKEDPDRPMELVTLVLRSAVFGLLKSCALAWVELSQGKVYDQEDWQSEKCEVSLCEAIHVGKIVARLEEAIFWLANTPKLQAHWRNRLVSRLRLRKILLEIAALDTAKERGLLLSKLNEGREVLQHIKQQPPVHLPPDSRAVLAFDPFITRRLHSFMPLRVLDLPPQENTWGSLDHLFSGLQEIYHLSGTASLATWEIVGSLRAWSPVHGERLTYTRCLTQRAFHYGNRVLTGYAPIWIVDRFFLEAIGVPYGEVSSWIEQYWTGADDPPLLLFENRIIKLVTDHIHSAWYNLPRRRRHLMNMAPEWHTLHDLFVRLVDLIDAPKTGPAKIFRLLPHIPLLWRLNAITHIVYSGFQLELYADHEKLFAYWYAAQVLETRLGCIEDVLSGSPLADSLSHDEWKLQHTFLTALQCMSVAMTITLTKMNAKSYEIGDHSFSRRYKWALKGGSNSAARIVDIATPSLEDFKMDCEGLQSQDPSGYWSLAKDLLSTLSAPGTPIGWADIWSEDRLSLMTNLYRTCEDHLKNPVGEVKLVWEPEAIFPRLR